MWFPTTRGDGHTFIARLASTERTTSCPMARMDKKAAPVQQPISPAGHSDGDPAEAGFTLIEVVCVVAILAILAVMVMLALSRGTSRTRLEAYEIGRAT